LGSKGLFKKIFACTKDKDRVFEEGPYLFNSAGLHLRYWRERFSLEKEDFTEGTDLDMPILPAIGVLGRINSGGDWEYPRLLHQNVESDKNR